MSTLEDNKLIFSDVPKYRIIRHLLFWGLWGFYFGMVRELNPVVYKQTGHFPNLFVSLVEAFLILLPQAVLVYPLLYFILPRYVFTGKYFSAAICFIVFMFLAIFFNAVLLTWIPWPRVIYLSSYITLFEGVSYWQRFQLAYLSALQGSLTCAALAASFKMFKFYYLKNMRNQQLMKENIAAQLQLLKAQVHPHFLFNTLNNIFSQTQTESPKGSKMIMGLSDMLRYILYEGQKPLVSLKQELLMITEYINLEKIRYGNKLDVHVLMPDKSDNLFIAPLLLLPFVENCFKHGASNVLENPWINLTIELKSTTLVMKLMNGKASAKQNVTEQSGIGISNVRQRLDFLYKEKYDLQIREDEDVFVVDLRVDLIKIENKQQADATTETRSEVAYD
jgi:sensor histidine kinase YesM